MTEAAWQPPRGCLPPHASLVTPRLQKTVPLLHNLSYLHGDFPRGASTIRVKFQIAATNVPKLVEVCCFLHVDLRSSFGTPFQGDRRILTLARDG